MAARADADGKGILTAVGGNRHLGHGQVEEIDGIDAHPGLRA
jgi:hypothetical protein